MKIEDEISEEDFRKYSWSVVHAGEVEKQLPSIRIVTNIEDEKLIEAAIDNWTVRTDDYTAESLCAYINSKRIRGLTDHYAFTEEQFSEMLIQFDE